MKRQQLRDEIRTLANIAGDNTLDFLINQLIDEEIKKYTRLRKYPECFLTGVNLPWEDNLASTLFYNYAILPADMQHLDVDNIYFNNEAFLRNLSKWSRIYTNSATGPVTQFRLCTYLNAHTGVYDKVLEITPGGSISFATDTVRINYWRAISWDETTDFPIAELESTVMNKVVARIANLQSSGALSKRADIAATEHYIASRGTNLGDKF